MNTCFQLQWAFFWRLTFRKVSHLRLFALFILGQSPSHRIPLSVWFMATSTFDQSGVFHPEKEFSWKESPNLGGALPPSLPEWGRIRERGRPKGRSAVAAHNLNNLLLWSAALHCSSRSTMRTEKYENGHPNSWSRIWFENQEQNKGVVVPGLMEVMKLLGVF